MYKYICVIIFFFPIYGYTADALTTAPKAEVEEQKDFFNLTAYDPIYFLYNSDTSKIQASFKYKVAKDLNLFFGYTHNIFWQLNEESQPLKDVNYNPEIFYRFTKVKRLNQIDIIGGHKSNGKDEAESRSFNYIGLNLNPKFKLRKNTSLYGKVKFRYLFVAEENKDLLDFISPIELQGFLTDFSYGIFEKTQLNFRLYPGGDWGQKWSRGGQEVGVAFRIRGLEITPSFYIQYFQGYGENLLEYNQFQKTFRVGFLL